MDSQNVTQLLEQIEADLLAEIIDNLKRNQIDSAAAQQLAKEFLSHLPQNDFAGLLSVLQELSAKYPAAHSVLIKYQSLQAKNEDEQKIRQMGEHLAVGNIDKAIDVAKGGVL